MSAIHGNSEFELATARRQSYGPLEGILECISRVAQRERLRAALDDLGDRELMDIGIARSELDYVARSALSAGSAFYIIAALVEPDGAMLPWICRGKSMKSVSGPSATFNDVRFCAAVE
ncbi:DUF1127 domain-containing protein [Bradyrhizobium liaoningense]|uniref:DUF1127 domain-containing protein n=1 Tax=Bradyrhizobium liaoningense TaxID=43992 RepID=UPI001BABF3DD|nr:DUF1127 domain-containing protein [Bradyrhizobium liaoningense]MBR0738463.1 DUF1127 domain-containing protein [Bradyrhizobium liaoningense]